MCYYIGLLKLNKKPPLFTVTLVKKSSSIAFILRDLTLSTAVAGSFELLYEFILLKPAKGDNTAATPFIGGLVITL